MHEHRVRGRNAGGSFDREGVCNIEITDKGEEY